MKIVIGPKVLPKLSAEARAALRPEPCGCADAKTCESCEGSGTVFVMPMTAEDEAAMRENFSRQGLTLPGSN